MKLNFYVVIFLGCIWLQAASGRSRHIFESDERRRHFKRIAEKWGDYLSEQDPYFGGDNNGNDDQPKISEDDLPRNGELFEGDIVMDDSIRRAVLGLNEKRSAIELARDGELRHWPKGVVPYVIGKSLSTEIRTQLRKAIRRFNHYTCIKYIPKRAGDKDYVEFVDGSGCSSSVGRQGGKQLIHLNKACERLGTVMHEMMHAIGIIHEQSRDDRDKHVKVRFDHIKKELESNFRKYSLDESVDLGPYNFLSVMHYSNHAFSNDGEATLVSRTDPTLKFGQRVDLTPLDIDQINKLYKCSKKYSKRNLIPDMTEEDVKERKRDEDEDLYEDLDL